MGLTKADRERHAKAQRVAEHRAELAVVERDLDGMEAAEELLRRKATLEARANKLRRATAADLDEPQLEPVTEAPQGMLAVVARPFDAGEGILDTGAVVDLGGLLNAEKLQAIGYFQRQPNSL